MKRAPLFIALFLLLTLVWGDAFGKAPRVAVFGRPVYTDALYTALHKALVETSDIRTNKNRDFLDLMAGKNLSTVLQELSSGKNETAIQYLELKRAIAGAAIDATPKALTRLGRAAKTDILLVVRATKLKEDKLTLSIRRFDVKLRAWAGPAITLKEFSPTGKTTPATLKKTVKSLFEQTADPKKSKKPLTAKTPLYKKWWFWVIIGSVAALGTTFAILNSRKSDKLNIHIIR